MQKRAKSARGTLGHLVAVLVLAVASFWLLEFGSAEVPDHGGSMTASHVVWEADAQSRPCNAVSYR